MHDEGGVQMTDTTHLEEKIAHLTKTVDELSDVVARQETEIDRLTRQVTMLVHRAAEQEAEMGGSVVIADQKPPHW